MTQESQHKNFIEWLKTLGRDSWQMELLVSGFSIAAIFNISDFLTDGINHIAYHTSADGLWQYALIVLRLAVKLTGINLFAHVILRSFWIGAIGLHSVSPNLDFDKLGYGSFFTNKLKKRVKSLDELIAWLDQICSSIFAFTFLVVLCFIAFLFFSVFLVSITLLLNKLGELFPDGSIFSSIASALSTGIALTLLLTSLLYLFDFLTLGLIKKKNWFGKIYYPFYYLYNIITLAPLYRGIYYHFINQFSRGRLGLIFISYIGLSFIFHAYTFEYYIFIPDNTQKRTIKPNQYVSQLSTDEFIEVACIQSDIITDPFIRLFIRYNVRDNEALSAFCYTPVLKEGFNRSKGSNFYINNKQVIGRPKSNANPEQALECLSNFYQVFLNGSPLDSIEFNFYTHPNHQEKGIITYIPISGLPAGKNVLELKKQQIHIEENPVNHQQDTTFTIQDYSFIPFWLGGE